MTFHNAVYAAAQTYIERGWWIFPLHTIVNDGKCSCGTECGRDAGKHPRLARGLKKAAQDAAKIEEWFGPDAPPSNIAIVTGEISSITVLDVDVGPGKFGAESWAEAIKDHGEPDTLIAQTGSGGMHLIFQYNSALKTASNVLGKGIDCRNDGGYIVAPPSRHLSGQAYTWLNDGVAPGVLPAHLSHRKEARGRPRKDDMHRGKYSVEQVRTMLEVVPADDRDLWRSVGVILGREFDRIDDAWALYVEWAEKFTGQRGRNHDQIMHEAFYDLSQQASARELTLGTIVKVALDNGWAPKAGEVPIGNFIYYGPGNNFIYRPTISHWVAAAVDAAVSPINESGKLKPASDWLKANVLATSLTSEPLIEEDYVKGVDCRDGEVVKVPGGALYNTYRRPTIELGDARLAWPFVHHVEKMLPRPGDSEQFLKYMAHRAQAPAEKPRFALLIAGGQGVGKDTAVEFCCPAIGLWNVANIDPSAFEQSFNEYVAATLIRISEAANLHEMSKWAFNERTKVLIAGSPDYAVVNPKYGTKFFVRMHCGVIVTTNHLASGIYIPADDRRYDVMECATLAEMGLENDETRREYFEELWGWFLREGGASHVAAYLHEVDLSSWSAANGQRKTEAHAAVVAVGMVGDAWLDDVLGELEYPAAVRSDWIIRRAVEMGEKEADLRRKLGAALGRVGYVMYRCSTTVDGRWKLGERRTTVYVKPSKLGERFDPGVELTNEAF